MGQRNASVQRHLTAKRQMDPRPLHAVSYD
jgi:hypothetical protein